MYISNIAAWVVSTLTVAIVVGIAAPFLSIYTYGPHKSFDFTYTIIPVYEGDELIPREFIIDMFASDGYAKHLVVSNGVPGKTIDYRTGAIN